MHLAARPSSSFSRDHPERARGDAVAASVADVGLHDDGAELGAEQRTGWAHVETGRFGAVLAHVRAHQPHELGGKRRNERLVGHGGRRGAGRGCLLLDEGDVPPGRGRRVVRCCRRSCRLSAPTSLGSSFHSLQATSQALQPMHTEVSVKKPYRTPAVGASGTRRAHGRPPSWIGGRPPCAGGPRRWGDVRRRCRTSADLVSWMKTFGIERESQQVVGGVADAQPLRTPVEGDSDLVHGAAGDGQRSHPVGDEHREPRSRHGR